MPQVRTLESFEDELATMDYLRSKFGLLFAVRESSTKDIACVPVEKSRDRKLIVFLKDHGNEVSMRVKPVRGKALAYHVAPRDGLCIEWNRTIENDHVFNPGRYYFKPLRVSNCSAEISSVFRCLQRYIKKTYFAYLPDVGSPIFVGPQLRKNAIRAKVQLAYPSGEVISVG